MLVEHLFQYRISPWPKTAEKRGSYTGFISGPTDGPTDRPSDRDAFLKTSLFGKALVFSRVLRDSISLFLVGPSVRPSVGHKTVLKAF